MSIASSSMHVLTLSRTAQGLGITSTRCTNTANDNEGKRPKHSRVVATVYGISSPVHVHTRSVLSDVVPKDRPSQGAFPANQAARVFEL